MTRIITRTSLAVLALAGVLCGTAAAQDTEVQELVVTGSRMNDYDPVETPHVTLVRRADNLITEIRVVCDTRDLSQRKTELRSTLRNLIRAAAADGSIELGIGEEVVGGFDETMIENAIHPDSRPDTSYAELLVKTRVTASDTFDGASGRIESFIDRTPKVGRTEVLRQGDWGLTLIGPEKNRAELIGKVAADAKADAAIFGADMSVSVEGLQRPISWYQSGPLDLALYIPYKLTIVPLRR